MGYIQCEAPKIAKLVQITPITMVYGTQIVTGAYKPTYNWGASHCIYIYICINMAYISGIYILWFYGEYFCGT